MTTSTTLSRREQFERDGFLLIENFKSAEECDELKARTLELIGEFEPTDEHRSIFSTVDQTKTSDEYFIDSGADIRFFFEADAFDENGELRQPLELSLNKIGHAMHDLDPVFDRFSRDPALADLADELGFSDHVIMQSMYIFKQPHIGGEVVCHDDHSFLWTDPPSCVGFWFAIEDATLENGAMWALPGGHRIGPKKRFKRVVKDDGSIGTAFDIIDPEPYPTDGIVPLEAPKGSLVVLHGLLPHLSGPNESDKSRHAYTIHCVDRNARWPEDNWLQRPELPLRGFRD